MVDPTPRSSTAPVWGTVNRALLVLGRLGLGAIFLYAAYTKLRHPWMLFAFSINSYRVLPEWAVTVAARTLPWVELALGGLLIVGYQLRYVAAAASSLLLLFFGVMLRSHFKGLGIDCGCFGFGEKLGVRTLVRDGLLLVVSLALTASAFLTRRSKRRWAAGTLESQKAE